MTGLVTMTVKVFFFFCFSTLDLGFLELKMTGLMSKLILDRPAFARTVTQVTVTFIVIMIMTVAVKVYSFLSPSIWLFMAQNERADGSK